MRKRTKAETENWKALEEGLRERDAVAMEVMQEVFARLPYGQRFALSDGSVAHLEKLSPPELCADKSSHYYESPKFGVDVVIEGGKLDHVEISAFQTGWGMAIDPSMTRQPPEGWAARETAKDEGKRRASESSSADIPRSPRQGRRSRDV